MPSVAVIGAGLVGSLAASFFAQQHYDVILIEQRKGIFYHFLFLSICLLASLIHSDIRTLRRSSTEGRKSINLALSVRGLAGLGLIGVDKDVLEYCVPMKGRLVHALDGSLSSQPYGLHGEVRVLEALSGHGFRTSCCLF